MNFARSHFCGGVAVVRAILLAATLLPAGRGLAQPTLAPIRVGGPDANRIRCVFLSEGYRSAQFDLFYRDCTNAMNALLSRAPFSDYPAHFNAYAIAVPSTDAGSDHPSSGILRNTYFNSTYDADERMITIPSGAQGQGKVDGLLASLMPEPDLVVLLVNDRVPGGSDGGGATVIVATSAYQFLAHETGHVLAGLGDEYTSPYPGFPEIEDPNTTRETRREFIKWKDWIAPETPVPTPPIFAYKEAVGLFEGAHYHVTGWYRPKLDCAMNRMEVPFCEVCAEALVLSFYQRVRPVEGFSPAGSAVALNNPAPVVFNLDLLAPATQTLSVEWRTNGAPIPGASGSVLVLSPGNLPNGTHTLSAVVRDLTARVRNDPSQALVQTVSWTLQVDLPVIELQLGPVLLLADNQLAIRVSGSAPGGVVLQSSPDLRQWTPSGTNTLSAGHAWFTNEVSGPGLFYRAAAR